MGNLPYYLELGCYPGGTQRNWSSYGHKVSALPDEWRYVLADPQTSGGLLVAVQEEGAEAFEELLRKQGLPAAFCRSFGRLGVRMAGPLITVD
jgi:selenide,water dikinase